ncbi:hypothetical protein MIND_00614400 [Mycena indigotica]|uniref:EXPERA domain-containing protein n=1 Tax=Mycena indigotica TaxID=2126181 RepID=A0A8H6SPY7_9AGAR|nr:uncharacterized protein MIND_00614400 [Mycena indigotica]KAF7303845.1 hypothetical protein MIND_00614400 [Mycena indigotica]
MAPKTHTWITAWFLLTAPIIAWDVGYCFFTTSVYGGKHPHTNLTGVESGQGGDLHWIWKPYSIYQRVDLVYGVEALERGDGFTNAQSLLNVIETLLNVLYVYLAHVKAWPPASLVGLSAATMTLSKTVLYWVQEYFCNYCAVGHNTMYDAIVYWIIPNGFWIVVPIFIVNRLSRDLAAELNFAAKAAAKSKSK